MNLFLFENGYTDKTHIRIKYFKAKNGILNNTKYVAKTA